MTGGVEKLIGFLVCILATGLSGEDPATPAAPRDGPQGGGAPASELSLLQAALRAPEERRGDYDALVTRWLAALAAGGDTAPAELAELIARRVAEVKPYLKEPTAHIDAVEKVLASGPAGGRWRLELRSFLADLYRAAGDEDRADTLDRGSGHLRRWWAIGPFDKQSGRSTAASFPPETEQELSRTYTDGWQTLRWRAFELEPRRTVLRADEMGYPRRGVFYLLSQFRSTTAASAILERRTADDTRVWLNGELVANDDTGVEFLSVPRLSEVRLVAGWNRVLVKTPRPFSLRITDLDGRPLALEPADTTALEPLNGRRGAGATPLSGESLDPPSRWRSALAAAAARDSEAVSADEYIGLALLALQYGRDDLAVEAADDAMQRSAEDPFVLYHTGRVFQQAAYLPPTLARNRAETAFSDAAAADADFLPAYERLAGYLMGDKKFAAAAAKARAALDRSPGSLTALTRLKRIYAEAGWLEEEISTVSDIEKYAPASVVPALFWADYYSQRTNLVAARNWYEKAIALDASQVRLLGRLAEIEIQQGDVAAAEAHLREWVRRAPESSSARRAWLDFLTDQRRFEEALTEARAYHDDRPQDPRGALRVAGLLERLERHAEALDAYRAALALEPGQLDVERYVDALRGGLDRFWEPYDEKLEDWMPQVPSSGRLVEKATSIAILDIGVLRVESDGSSSSYIHQAFRLLSEESKDKLANVSTPGEVVSLRTITPAGDVLEPVPATGRRQYVMPGLSAGGTVEFSYRIDRSQRQGQRLDDDRFYFHDPEFSQSFLLSRYVVIIEPGAEVEFDETNLDGRGAQGFPEELDGVPFAAVDRTERQLDDGSRVVIYEAREASRIDAERFQPIASEYVPNVRVVAPSDWEAVERALRRREHGRTRPTAELRRAAEELTEGLTASMDKALALFKHVNEIVPSGRGSSQAVRVLLEKAGDRTTLFKALLDQAGVPCSWAYLRPRESVMPRTDWAHPDASLFPYRYVAVEAEEDRTQFVSLSSRTLPFGLLPDYLYGGRALILGADSSSMVNLPGPDVTEIATSFDVRMQLGEDVGGEVRMEVVSRAAEAYSQKESFRTVQGFQKQVILQGIANRFFPGCRLKKGEFTGISDDVTPFTIALELTAQRLLEPRDGAFLLKPLQQPLQLVRSYGGQRDRRHPVHLRSSRVVDDRTEIELSSAYRVQRIPRQVVLATALGNYSLTYERRGDSIVVRRRASILPGRLTAEEYPAFVEFCERVDATETENILLEKLGPNGGSE